ncbi:MAG: hypothetical protein Q4D81_03395 [Eubacteriales bacterium]|nr:hypothetical protein [Eubacteriales bacterium]
MVRRAHTERGAHTDRTDTVRTHGRAAYPSNRSIPGRRKPGGITVDEGNLEAARTKTRVKTTSMSFRTLTFMILLIAAMTAILLYYIKIQADVTRSSQELADLEQELTEMKAENDAAYNEINDRISLEEIREKAIHELGMKYADKEQVVIYSGTETDTVHQVGTDGN